MKKFTIVGGGIGGLTLAIALLRKGFDVTIYESATEIKPLGAGIVLAANAIKAYQAIGLAEDILEAGSQVKLLQIKNERGSIISEVDAEKFSAHYGINNFTIHRADLHRVLLNHIPAGVLQKGKTCVDFIQEKDGVVLRFSDGTTTHTSYVIACDGIHSPIRKKLLPKSLPRFAGYTCWRAVINEYPEGFDPSVNSETWGTRGRFGLVPLNNKSIYWFACINTSRVNDPVMRGFQQTDLLNYFQKFHDPIPEVIRKTKAEQLIWNDILDLKPLKQFAFNNIVLLGDAAHATTPNMGQGACMAIEDAVILANCIESDKSVENAFRQYERKRIGRTTQIINTSRRIGQIAQWENKFLTGLRNAALKATPQSVTEKQMRFVYDISFQ